MSAAPLFPLVENAPPAQKQKKQFNQHCVVCGTPFTVFAPPGFPVLDTCGSQDCLLHHAQRYGFEVPLLCSCPQREFPHELSIHSELRGESYNPKFKFRWPWSLMLSKREEPSTERKVAA